MVQTCSRCSRVNPEEASFCYFDGIGLGGRSHASAGVQMDFPKPIRYPSGKTCGNFNELASTILSDWSISIEMMKKGEFGTFFSGIGRLDLAMVATESAKHPDPAQGLDQFLARLPRSPSLPQIWKSTPHSGSWHLKTRQRYQVLGQNSQQRSKNLVWQRFHRRDSLAFHRRGQTPQQEPFYYIPRCTPAHDCLLQFPTHKRKNNRRETDF